MNLALPFLTALLLSVILTPWAVILAKKYGLVDDPKRHKHPAMLHTRPIPRAGGLPIFLAFLVTIFLTIEPSKKIWGIILGGFILVAIGLVDDKYDLKQWLKFLLQIGAATIVVGFGVGITFITNPLSVLSGSLDVVRLDTVRIAFNFLGEHSILLWADLFALLWIVWVMNMVNFSSGVDGQMPGIVLVTLFVLFVASLRFVGGDPNQIITGKLALAGMGATLGFLIYNFYPAKIFPGDSGSFFLGYLVAVLAILSGAKVGTAVLVMAVPFIDGLFTIVRRVVSGKSPFAGDRGHLHHMLMGLGWGQRRIALFYYIVCAILGATALSLTSSGKLFATALFGVVILGGLIWLNINLPRGDQK